MTKIRIEYVRLVRGGDDGAIAPEVITLNAGGAQVLKAGLISVQSEAAPELSDDGHDSGFYARCVGLRGSGVVEVGPNPTADKAGGTFVTAGSSVLVPIKSGEKVALIEVEDRSATIVQDDVVKFRDGFSSIDPELWDLVLAATDFAGIDGNTGGSGFLKITKSPLVPDTETVLISKRKFRAPIRYAWGATFSQRIAGQEIIFDCVGVDADGAVVELASVPEVTVPAGNFSVTSNVATQVMPAGHGLKVGDRIANFQFNDSRFNAGSVILTGATATAVTFGLTIANGAYPHTGGKTRRMDAFGYARDALGLLFDGTSHSNGIYGNRSDGSSALLAAAASMGTNLTLATTPTTPVNYNAPGSYCFNPTLFVEVVVQLEAVQFNTFAVDSTGSPAFTAKRSQIVPDQDVDLKLRVRVRNLPNLTVPTGEILSVVKTGTTTATVTLRAAPDRPLTTADFITTSGTRDSANFPNLTTPTQVASVISPTQFTILWGAAVTSTMYGGSVWRAQGNVAPANVPTATVVSVQRTLGQLLLNYIASPGLVQAGETVWLHGFTDTTGAVIAGLTGRWRVYFLNTTTFQVTLEPLDGQTVADLALTNCAGSMIKATDVRLHFLRILDYPRNLVEVTGGRNTADAAMSIPAVITAILGALAAGTNTIGAVFGAANNTTNGATIHRLIASATVNATSVKTSAGKIVGGFIHNLSASTKYLKFYNKASAPTVGTDTPVITVPIAPNEKVTFASVNDLVGIYFSTGLAYAVTGALADNDTTALVANDVVVFLNYA